MKVLAIIFCLCFAQIASVLGQDQCAVLRQQCDVNCYNGVYNGYKYYPGSPIINGTYVQTTPDQYGNYNCNCNCAFVREASRADNNCDAYCKSIGYSSSGVYRKPGININCACGRVFSQGDKPFFYRQN